MSSPKTMLQHALDYAAIGWRVFPVTNQKKPMTPNGFKDGTTDTSIIESWWKKWPEAGIGVATGIVSGIVVLDVDMGKEGAEENLRTIVRDRGLFPQNVVARTGGGGYHFYFAHPGEKVKVANAQNLFHLAGIDIRGDGGYVVVPPSGHASGNFYEWGEGQSPFEARLESCPEYFYNDRAATLAQGAFQFAGPITSGERNATLASIAGLLRSMGLQEPEIRVVLRSQNALRCQPPLSDTEVDTIASYITNYPPRNNRPEGIIDRAGLTQLLTFERSDAGFGAMLAFALLGQIKYNHTSGRWLLWRTHYWEEDTTQEILLRAIDTTMLFKQAADVITDEDLRTSAQRYALHIQHRSRLEAGMFIASAQPAIASTHTDWNKNLSIVAAQNGVINLRTGELSPGRAEDLISAFLPIEYDPEAECPLWLKFLDDIFQGDQDVISFVQSAVGYSLTGENTEQCLFLLVGKGANGKSTFLDTIHAILGRYAYPAPFSTFERNQNAGSQTNDLAALAGRRLVSASEPNEGVTLSESRIKSLTGGESISARFLHQEFFEFKPTFKIWLGVNHLPRVVDDSDGFWRRVKRIDFPVQFWSPNEMWDPDTQKPKDPDLGKKLKAEYAGILAWAVRGAIKWYENGLVTPATVIESTKVYRTDSDPLHEFFETHCEQDPNAEVDADEFYKAYTAHCKSRMMKAYEILSSNRFGQRLSREFTAGRLRGNKSYIGIRLKEDSSHLLTTESPISIKIRPKGDNPSAETRIH